MSQVKSADDCGCGAKDGGGVCEHNRMKRPRYFHGMLLDERDFLAEQAYHAAKRRMLNRMLHGWGVVCGLELEWQRGKRWVRIMPGMALDCFGNEIWVAEPYEADLSRLLTVAPARTREPCSDQDGGVTTDWYLCLRYHETNSDPVPVYVSGGDCNAHGCEFSRVREGFCVGLEENCPDSGPSSGLVTALHGERSREVGARETSGGCVDCAGLTGEKKRQCETLAEFCSRSVPCPDCKGHPCNSHCVVVGRVTVNEQGCVTDVCANECRRYVLSGRMVEHLAVSVLAGAEKLVEGGPKDIPSIQQIVTNPIHALCWALKKLLDESDGDLTEVVTSTLAKVRGDDSGSKAQESPSTVQEQPQVIPDPRRTDAPAAEVPQADPAAATASPAPATSTRRTRSTTPRPS
jgi:hypothetical protein